MAPCESVEQTMAADDSTRAHTESATCSACGSQFAAAQSIVDDGGRIFCRICHADQQPLVELHLDTNSETVGELPLIEVDDDETEIHNTTGGQADGDEVAGEVSPNETSYQCSVCRKRLPGDQIYESNGLLTCTKCWDRAHAPPAGAAATSFPPPAAPKPKPMLPARPLLLARVTCPHCWHQFPPQDVLWVARHAELIGDPVAGPDAPLRFLSSQFTVDGAARDPRGMVCQSLACPRCHLIIPRPLIEAEPLFASIVGVSASGKSYFLTAMTWELRRLLSRHFGVAFNDADPSLNRTLNQHEETLFLAADPEQHVKLDKTDTVGSLHYDQIRMGQQVISLPRPFLFTMRPTGRHPNADAASQSARVVCVYDNAGEHFSPGEDTATSPVTQHLGSSRVLMFLYDPTQDPRFRARFRNLSADPQLGDHAPTRRQETILIETVTRIRQYAGLPATQPIKRPLLVVIPKADVWGKLIDLDLSTEPIIPDSVAQGRLDGVDLNRVELVSDRVRGMLLQTAPEFVSVAEELCSKTIYIPISALGSSPETAPGREGLWIRPSQVKPRWVTVPFLYMFARWSHDVIGGVRV
jgi:hypothetical protein